MGTQFAVKWLVYWCGNGEWLINVFSSRPFDSQAVISIDHAAWFIVISNLLTSIASTILAEFCVSIII